MDPYQRAKTVRIGKWRWPPPKEEMDQSFMHFKMKQNQRKSSDGKVNRLYLPILFYHIHWFT